MEYSGGELLIGPWGEAAAAKITPDASGISYYDEALFLEVMRTGYVKARKLNSIMPFGEFKELADDDLKAIFAYLRALKPVKHRVDNSLPPTILQALPLEAWRRRPELVEFCLGGDHLRLPKI